MEWRYSDREESKGTTIALPTSPGSSVSPPTEAAWARTSEMDHWKPQRIPKAEAETAFLFTFPWCQDVDNMWQCLIPSKFNNFSNNQLFNIMLKRWPPNPFVHWWKFRLFPLLLWIMLQWTGHADIPWRFTCQFLWYLLRGGIAG